MTNFSETIEDIIESYINGQRKQMLDQYQNACRDFGIEDVLLMLGLSESLNQQEFTNMLIALLKQGA